MYWVVETVRFYSIIFLSLFDLRNSFPRKERGMKEKARRTAAAAVHDLMEMLNHFNALQIWSALPLFIDK